MQLCSVDRVSFSLFCKHIHSLFYSTVFTMAEATHQLADVAAKTAWHDSQNTEPLSGASGDVSKGEPFDAGNLGT